MVDGNYGTSENEHKCVVCGHGNAFGNLQFLPGQRPANKAQQAAYSKLAGKTNSEKKREKKRK